ncbi:MAG TPA: MipA/OmpV family protein [Steroidobacteraceae bacterium]|nr:MipA/OmpV family protein [Steroidobacteraceae bacterium]
MKILLKVAALWAVATLAIAQGVPADAAASQQTVTQEAPAAPPAVLPPERRWRLGAAVGYGERTNPLIQSDDIPVLIDLDIAYFGDHWFFDNGDLGLEFLDNDVVTANLVARVNSDRAFFSKTNTRYVTYSLMAGGNLAMLNNPQTGAPLTPVEALPLEPPKRSYAIEAGVEALFGGEWGQASLHAFHDVSRTHDGYELAADYSYRITRGRLSLSPSVGVSYKSSALSDYYWGVHKDEQSVTLAAYRARGGLGWEAGLRTNYYLTKSVRLAVSANYERLQHSISQSPLVERDYVFGYFAGVGWQF